jgi:hypothetical protein
MSNKKIFYLTEGTIRTLAREMDLPKDKVTPDMVTEVAQIFLKEFRDWDNWIKEIIANVVEERSQQ